MLQKAIFSPLAALVLGQQWQLWLAVQPGSAGKERKKECDTAGESAACLKKNPPQSPRTPQTPQKTFKSDFNEQFS
jgi:hypothetical protein